MPDPKKPGGLMIAVMHGGPPPVRGLHEPLEPEPDADEQGAPSDEDANDQEQETSSGTIPKQAVLYIFRPETNYTCGGCIFLWSGSTCAVYSGPASAETGGCGYYIHGDPGKIKPFGLLTKEQVGYAENPKGFSCKRCEYFLMDEMDCREVDKDSDGDTPGIIHPNACCNEWEADSERAGNTDEDFESMASGQVPGPEAAGGPPVGGGQ